MPAEQALKDTANTQLLVAGGTLLDESVTLEDSLQPGESNRADWSTSVGGVACNVFRGAAPLASSALFSALGNDDIGRTIRLCLEQSPLAELASFSFKISDDLATGRYSAILDQAGELVIGLANSDATDALLASDIIQAVARQQNLQLLALDTNLSARCLKETCQQVSSIANAQKNIQLAAIAVSPVKCMRLADLGEAIDFLFLNRQEAAMLSGLPASSELVRLSQGLLAMQFSSHVLTDGSADVLVHEAGETHFLPIAKATAASPDNGQPRPSVNGAGDALAGASLAQLCHGDSLLESVRNGGLPAARAVIQGHSVLPWPTINTHP